MRRLEPLLVAAGVAGVFGLWEVLVALGVIDARIAPAPSTIAPMIVELLARGAVLQSLGITAWEVAVAFLLSIPVGFFIGFSLAEMPGIGAVLRPVVNFLFGVPKSIFLPVFILIFGVGFEQKVAFGIFTTIFVLILGGIAAVESVPRELITVARAYGASRWQVVREIYLPSMAPILMESARLGMIFNITAVLLAEIYGARDGIGYRIAGWGESLQMPQLYAALVIVATLAIVVNELLRVTEVRLGAWRQSAT
jgi:NitT/TauT family transport system permease protein